MSTTGSTDTNTDTSTTSATPTKINPEQSVAFAALILADDNLYVTPERLQALLKAAGISEIEPIWTTLFANALKGKNVKEILTAIATSGPKAGSRVAPGKHRGDDQGSEESEPEGIDIQADSDSDDNFCSLFD